MSETNFQNNLYDDLYQQPQFQTSLPDYKITGGNEIAGKKILSIGSGTSRDIWYLTKSNKITALDYSKSVLPVLRSKGIELKVFNIEKRLPFKDHSFDLIIAKDILEHLNYPFEICSEIRRVLKSDGYAVINVPNHFCLPMRLKYFFGGNLIWKTPGINHEKIFDEWNYMHIRFFTWKGFQKMMDRSKLKIIKTYFDIFTLNHYTDPELVKLFFSKHQYQSIFRLLITAFNFLFPPRLRSFLAGLNPNLLTGSFYVWVKAA